MLDQTGTKEIAKPQRTLPARSRRRRFGANVPSPVISLASLAFILAIWELFGREINPLFASYPSAIFAVGSHMVANGELFYALIQSLQPLALGYFLAAAIGIPLGLLIGRYRWAEAGLGIYMTAGYATPLVALIPLFILWFGLNGLSFVMPREWSCPIITRSRVCTGSSATIVARL